MLSKEKYFELNICDEKVGSWGSQGIETACKGWFNSMRVVTNTNTHYGHMFRVTDIPYERPQKDIDKARDTVRKMFHPDSIEWLVEKFDFPSDWTEDKLKDFSCKSPLG